MDVNRAPREALLRVPGLGVKSVDRIIQARRHRRLRADDLARIGVPLRRAAPFLTATDHSPGALARQRAPGGAGEAERPARSLRLMRSIVLADQTDWEGWRAAARALALDGVPPEEVVWSVQAKDDLFGGERRPPRPRPAPSPCPARWWNSPRPSSSRTTPSASPCSTA